MGAYAAPAASPPCCWGALVTKPAVLLLKSRSRRALRGSAAARASNPAASKKLPLRSTTASLGHASSTEQTLTQERCTYLPSPTSASASLSSRPALARPSASGPQAPSGSGARQRAKLSSPLSGPRRSSARERSASAEGRVSERSRRTRRALSAGACAIAANRARRAMLASVFPCKSKQLMGFPSRAKAGIIAWNESSLSEEFERSMMPSVAWRRNLGMCGSSPPRSHAKK
mmetsp:Transcript_127251/g.321523  ORF Transcript_127251/g.321523 Transcript_127251/m.321523 type:complete len:231 (-) Transcript_127251:12-704(-)